MKTVCLIPLRGGSKGIPGKNILPLLGKPLAAWVIEAALGASSVAEVWVSTDSESIREKLAADYPQVRFAARDSATATDTASTESVMIDFMGQATFDLLLTMQATSPLTRSEDIDAAVARLVELKADSLVTGVVHKRFYWSLDGKPLNYDPARRPRRQDFDGTLVENGAFYLTRREILEREHCRLGGHIAIYAMPEDLYHELDEPSDVPLIERALLRQDMNRLPRPRVLVCDVDGTLTDGGMFYTAEGDSLRCFNTRDAKGLGLLMEAGVRVMILSTENSPITKARCAKLGIPDCHIGVEDKRAFLIEWSEKEGIPLHGVAYIGDDVNDLEAMSLVACVACPADAVPAVRERAHHVCRAEGGRGAVREFAEWILRMKGN